MTPYLCQIYNGKSFFIKQAAACGSGPKKPVYLNGDQLNAV